MFGNARIPEAEWPAFFDHLLKSHRGHLCSIAFQKTGTDRPVRPELFILAGVLPDSSNEGDRIHVLLADWWGAVGAHVIEEPRLVAYSHPAEGIQETVQIDSAGGRTTMRFQAAD